MMKGVLTWMLIAVLIVVIGGTAAYVIGRDRCSYYIVDKGCALSYIDEYGLMHDDVFWFVLDNKETRLTLLVSPYTWYTYSVGGRYTGSVRAGMTYEGDDSIARYLKDGSY